MKKLIKKNKEIKNIYKLFKPELTPKKMLEPGIAVIFGHSGVISFRTCEK